MPILGIVASSISGHLAPPPEGGFDALASVTLSSTAASVSFAGIPSGYRHLQIRFVANIPAIAGANFRFNNDAGSSYRNHYMVGTGSGTGNSYADGGANTQIYGSVYGQGYDGGTFTFTSGVVDILDCADPTKNKAVRSLIGVDRNGSGAIQFLSGLWLNTSPVNQVSFVAEGATVLAAGTKVSLYGVK